MFGKLANAPFQRKEGSNGVRRKEGESLAGETSSIFLMVCPLAWHRLPARGGDSLQVHTVVLPGHGADGAQCREGGHWNICDGGEPLCRELPAATKQLSIWVVGADRYREEQMEDMCSSVPVHLQERQLRQPRDWGRLGCEVAQERVDSPLFRWSVKRGVPSGPVNRNRADRAPTKLLGSRPVSRTSATDRSGRWRPESEMATGVSRDQRR